MGRPKKHLLEVKEPFNLSIRRGIKEEFMVKISAMELDHNELIESFMFSFLHEEKQEGLRIEKEINEAKKRKSK